MFNQPIMRRVQHKPSTKTLDNEYQYVVYLYMSPQTSEHWMVTDFKQVIMHFSSVL